MNKHGLLVLLVLGIVASEKKWKEISEKFIKHLRNERLQRTQGLLKIIEDWKSGKEFLPFYLPTLPLKVSPMTLKYHGYTMSTSVLVINGLEDISVDYLTTSNIIIDEFTMDTNISIPRVKFHADWYNLQGEYWIFNIDETGELSGHIDGLRLYASLTLVTLGDSTELSRLRLNFWMDDIQVTLYGSSTLINDEFNHEMFEIISNKNNYRFMLNKIKEAINKVLHGQTVHELIQKINDYADDSDDY